MRLTLAGVVGVVMVLGLMQWRFLGNIDTAAIADHVVEDEAPQGVLNVLFIGSDSRDLGTSRYGSGDGTRRSDSLVLAHFTGDGKRVDAVQIPRDTLLDLPTCTDDAGRSHPGGQGMINSALQHGPGCSVRAVEKLSGVHVDHFVEVDFDGFASMVDALDGVEVCLPEPLQDSYAKLDLPAGRQRVDGRDALALARTRHAIGDGSDLGRMGHQQMVMSAIIAEVRSTGMLTRPDRLVRFVDAATKATTVDEGLGSTRALTGLAQRVRGIDDHAIRFISMPSAAAPSDPNRVVPTEAAREVFRALAADRDVPVAGDRDRSKPKPKPGPTATETPRRTSEPPVEATSRRADQDLCS